MARSLPAKAAPYLLLVAIALPVLFYRLGSLPFIGADECRYARIAQEMNQSGHWVTPLLQGYPWLEKPPLYYWITIPVFRLFGVSEAAARLGPALCALFAASSVLWLGWRLWSRRAGILSSTILLTSIGFCAYGRSASTDMPVTACFTAASAIFAAAILVGRVRTSLLVWAYVFLGLAVLAKGPVVLVLAAGILVFFWTLDEKGGSRTKLHLAWGMLITAAVAVPWYWLAFKENGFSFISIFFINQNLARYVSDVHHHEGPIYYFLGVLPGLLFPWCGWLTELMPASKYRKILNWRTWHRESLFLACWALFPVLFFSLSGSKLPGYILPSLPPVALLLGRRFSERIEHGGPDKVQAVARWCYLIVSLAAAAAFPFVLEKNYGNAWQTGALLAMAAAIPALAAFYFAHRGMMRAAFQTTTAQSLVLVLAVALFGFPVLGAYNSTRGIALQAREASADGESIITFCYFHHTLNYYTDYHIEANLLDPPALVDYARQHPRFLLVTERDRLRDLAQIHQLSSTLLAEEGKVRLLRVTLVRPQTSDLRHQTTNTPESAVGLRSVVLFLTQPAGDSNLRIESR